MELPTPRQVWAYWHYQRNKARISAKNKAWREANRERVRELQRQWKRDHPDRVRAATRKWTQKNLPRLREQWAQYRGANRAHLNASATQWRQENKERLNKRKRFLARLKSSGSTGGIGTANSTAPAMSLAFIGNSGPDLG